MRTNKLGSWQGLFSRRERKREVLVLNAVNQTAGIVPAHPAILLVMEWHPVPRALIAKRPYPIHIKRTESGTALAGGDDPSGRDRLRVRGHSLRLDDADNHVAEVLRSPLGGHEPVGGPGRGNTALRAYPRIQKQTHAR
jgi:hypothetical protein